LVLVSLAQHRCLVCLVHQHLRGHLEILGARVGQVALRDTACTEVASRAHMVAVVAFPAYPAYQVHLAFLVVLACQGRRWDRADLANSNLSIVCLGLD
jgi:hypothetical protein